MKDLLGTFLALGVALLVSSPALGQTTRPSDFGLRWVRSHPFTLMGLCLMDNRFDVQEYRQAGFNITLAWKDRPGMLSASASVGMPWCGRLGALKGADEEFKSRVTSLISEHPGNIGWLINDEPPDDATMKATGEALDWLRETYPQQLAFSNIGGAQDYAANVRRFRELVHPDLLMFDTYPFGPEGVEVMPRDLHQYLERLAIVREQALEAGIPYWAFVQSYENPRTPYLSESDVRVQVFASLALGYTGLACFTYDPPNKEARTLLEQDGQRSKLYRYVAAANAEAANLGQSLRLLRSTGIGYIAGEHRDPRSSASVQNGRPPRIPAWKPGTERHIAGVKVENLSPANDHLPGDVLIGYFAPAADGPADRSGSAEPPGYFMVVNLLRAHDPSAAEPRQKLRIEFSFANSSEAALERLDRKTGRVEQVPLNADGADRYHLELVLDGGCGDLFKFKDGKPFAGVAEGPADAVLAISTQPQLFLDDLLIARMQNLKRDMKQPTKHPANPLIRQDFPWEKRVMQVYGSILYEPEMRKFRCWYMASQSGDAIPDTSQRAGLPEYYICYAESEDGIHWTKPMVGKRPLGPYDKHNIVIAGGHGICVLKTPWDPDPNRLYKSVGGAMFATSPDGIDWTVHNWRSAVGKNDTGSSMVWWKGEYLAFVRNQEKDPSWPAVMRGVGLSISSDFEHWTTKRSVLVSDKVDGYPWVQPHALCVTAYGDQLIGLLPLLRITPAEGNNILGDMDVQLVVSRDGRNWQRVAGRAVFMPQEKTEPYPRRSWDMRFHPAASMLVKDDLVYIYYYGSKIRWGEGSWRTGTLRFGGVGGEASKVEQEDTRPREYGIGLATIPVDRFVSLRPINWEAEGILETRPLKFPGRMLLVNAELGVGRMAVEVLDEKGQVLPGFSAGQSKLAVRDPLRYAVTWSADGVERSIGDALAASGGRGVALRFCLRDGDLYAFQVEG